MSEPESQLPAVIDPNEAERQQDAKELREYGLSKEAATKLLIGKHGNGEWLNRRVARRAYVVDTYSDVDQIRRAIKCFSKLIRDKTISAKERTAAGQCLAELVSVKLKAGESVITHADVDGDEPAPVQAKPQVSVNLNFPPVVSSNPSHSAKASRPVIEAESSASDE